MIARITFAMFVVVITVVGLVSACGKSTATSTETGCGASLPCTISTNVTN